MGGISRGESEGSDTDTASPRNSSRSDTDLAYLSGFCLASHTHVKSTLSATFLLFSIFWELFSVAWSSFTTQLQQGYFPRPFWRCSFNIVITLRKEKKKYIPACCQFRLHGPPISLSCRRFESRIATCHNTSRASQNTNEINESVFTSSSCAWPDSARHWMLVLCYPTPREPLKIDLGTSLRSPFSLRGDLVFY